MLLYALLQSPAASASAAAQPGRFVPVHGGPAQTSAQTLLVTAYIVMWALLLLFVYLSWRRQQRIEARVGNLEKALAKADSGGQNQTE